MLCESQQLLPYAGLCWQAVARCENELGHSNGEISALVRGGRLFLQSERKGASLGCQNAGGENVQVGKRGPNGTQAHGTLWICWFALSLSLPGLSRPPFAATPVLASARSSRAPWASPRQLAWHCRLPPRYGWSWTDPRRLAATTPGRPN